LDTNIGNKKGENVRADVAKNTAPANFSLALEWTSFDETSTTKKGKSAGANIQSIIGARKGYK